VRLTDNSIDAVRTGRAMSGNVPTEPGYYWAKLKTPSGGNFYCEGLPPEMQGIRIEPEMSDDGSCSWVSDDWEIVHVWENVIGGYDANDDESLAVSVPGIPITQWPLDFYWGPKVQDQSPPNPKNSGAAR
jgi:hypothetical protein